MLVRVYAWIPRSYLHVVEIYDAIKKGDIDLNTSDVKINNKVEFLIKSYEEYKEIEFALDQDGLYTITAKLPGKNVQEEVKKFYKDAKRLLKEKIIKKAHPVTYDQINEGILPLNYSTIALLKGVFKPKGYESFKASGLTIYYAKDTYMKNAKTYVTGSENKELYKILDYKAFLDIIGHFFYDMMNKMEEYHAGTKEVIDLLETKPESRLLENAYLNFDLVKKDATESWTKIEQASNSLAKKEEAFNKIIMGQRSKTITKNLKLKESFERVKGDKEYVFSLWTLLLNHLENVDTAVEARINMKSIKALSVNQWLGAVHGGFTLASIIVGLFVLQTGMINNIFALVVFIVVWILIYEVVRIGLKKKFS